MYLNKIHFIGRIVHTPEIKTLPSGTMVATFTLANNRVWKDKNGQKQEDAEFIDVKYFGRVCEVIAQYAAKGQEVYVGGRIKTDKYQGKDGQTKWRTYIQGEEFQLGARAQNAENKTASEKSTGWPAKANQPTTTATNMPTVEYPDDDINPDDIPF